MCLWKAVFYGPKSIDSFTCTMKLFDSLKIKNVLVLRHSVQRFQTRFNLTILSTLFYNMRRSSSLHSCSLHQNAGPFSALIFTNHVNKGHFKNVFPLFRIRI